MTAIFQEPQLLFPVNLGMSLVDGRVGGWLGDAYGAWKGGLKLGCTRFMALGMATGAY